MVDSASNILDGNMISAIQQLQADLHSALKEKNWDRVPHLDEQLRVLIETAVESLQSPEGKMALQVQLQEIQAFYQTLIEVGTAHRNSLAQEIQQLRKNSTAVNQYLSSSFNQR